MKKLSLIFSILLSVIILSCSKENDEPIINGENGTHVDINGSEIENSTEASYNDTIIYEDKRTGASIDRGADLIFSEKSLKGYRVIVTITDSGISYDIHVPSEGAELNLHAENVDTWMKLGSIIVNEEIQEYVFEELGKMPNYEEDKHGNKYNYFYKLSNEYITLVYETIDELHITIPQNESKDKLYIRTIINDPPIFSIGATINFIQEGAK